MAQPFQARPDECVRLSFGVRALPVHMIARFGDSPAICPGPVEVFVGRFAFVVFDSNHVWAVRLSYRSFRLTRVVRLLAC